MKISNLLNQRFSVFFVSLLVLFATECIASTVNFNDPGTVTNGYSIYDYEIDQRTQLKIDFSGTLAVSLNMNYALVTDEYFAFKLINSTGITVNKVFFEFAKPEGEKFDTTPFFIPWVFSFYDKNDLLTVDWVNVLITGTDNIVGLDIPFLENREWYADETAYFFLNWDDFHNSRVNWTLNIDLNERDQIDGIVSAPIPSAVWLFGSGLVGLIVFPRRKNKGIGKQVTSKGGFIMSQANINNQTKQK